MPSRKIPKNYSNITGKINSAKSTRMLSYESKLERDYYFLFDFDNRIEQIYDQPITLEYIYNGKQRKYTPDVMLVVKDSPIKILGEVKYRNELMNKFSELRPKFEAAIDYCHQKENYEFKIFTDRCVHISSEIHKKNISFLLSNKVVVDEYKKLIEEAYEPFDTVNGLLAKVSQDRYQQMEILPTLWSMVRNHMFEVDLFKDLGFDTVLHIPHTSEKYQGDS